jgi:hypothetical protein
MFVDRIGAVLVTPRQAVRQIDAGRGSRDVGWLLAARVVAGETPRLARALVRGWEGNLAAAMNGILQAATAILPDLLAILAGAILLSLLAGRKKPDRTLDLAALAWIPYLAVELCGALLFTALGRPMRPFEEHAVDAVAVGWATVVWLLALVELKRT